MSPWRIKDASQKFETQGLPPPPPLFAAMSFWIVPDLPQDYREMLIDTIEAASGTIVEEMMSAQYILSNPPYANEPWHISFSKLSFDRDPTHDPIPAIRPYYWAFDCLLSLPPKILYAADVLQRAIFAQADEHDRRRPVKAYISINNPPTNPEDKESGAIAALNLEKLILRHGGHRTLLRNKSDILVLDTSTKQGADYERVAKPHQTVRTKDWVEQSVWSKVSMGRDVASSANKAKSLIKVDKKIKPFRQEFSREDDENITRYHAFAAPALTALTSLAFYKELLQPDLAHIYAWAHRHTAESWRERVRKRQATFRLRMEKYLDAGVDAYLKTRAERIADGTEREDGEAESGPRGALIGGQARSSKRSSRRNYRQEPTQRRLSSAEDDDDEDGAQDEPRARKRQRTNESPLEDSMTPPPASVIKKRFTPRAPIHPITSSATRSAVIAAPPPAAEQPLASAVASNTSRDEVRDERRASPSIPMDVQIDRPNKVDIEHVQSETRTLQSIPPLLGHNGVRRLSHVEPFADDWDSLPVSGQAGTMPARDEPALGSEAGVVKSGAGAAPKNPAEAVEEDEVVGYVVMPEPVIGARKAELTTASAKDSRGASNESSVTAEEEEDSDAPIEKDIALGYAVSGHFSVRRPQAELGARPGTGGEGNSKEGLSVVATSGLVVSPARNVNANRQKVFKDVAPAESLDTESSYAADTLDREAEAFFASKRKRALTPPPPLPPPPPEDLPARKRLSLGLPLIPVAKAGEKQKEIAAPLVGQTTSANKVRAVSRSASRSSNEGYSRVPISAAQAVHSRSDVTPQPKSVEPIAQEQQRANVAHRSPRGTPSKTSLILFAESICHKFGITMSDFVHVVEGLSSGINPQTIELAVRKYKAERSRQMVAS